MFPLTMTAGAVFFSKTPEAVLPVTEVPKAAFSNQMDDVSVLPEMVGVVFRVLLPTTVICRFEVFPEICGLLSYA